MLSRNVFSPLHALSYPAHRALSYSYILVPDWAGLFVCFSAAGTNGCLDVAEAVYEVETCVFIYDFHIGGILAPEQGELKTVWLLGGKALLVGCLQR